MLARLSVYEAERPARQFVLDEGKRYLVGRDESCAVRLADERLSRRHARLDFADDAWWLSDLCSKNGTLIDGRPVTRCKLADVQWFEIGGVIACFDHVTPETLDADRRRVAERWTTSVELSRTLRPSANLDALLKQALQSFLELAGAERGFVMLRQPDGSLATEGSVANSNKRFSGSYSVVRRSFDEMRPIVCCDVAGDSLLVKQASIVGGGISALVSVPLAIGDQVLGVIYVDSREAGKQFTDLDIDILQALAHHAALVIGVSRLQSDIVDLSALLPAELDRVPRADNALIRKLQELLPKLDRPGAGVVAGVAVGADR